MTTAQCFKGAEQERRRLEEEEIRESAQREFKDYGRTIVMINFFKYLGRVLTVADENCPGVVRKLWKARKSWARVSRILG